MPRAEWFAKDGRYFHAKHPGASLIVAAYGTSLVGFDWKKLEGRLTIGVNNSIQVFCPTYWMFTDRSIVRANRERRIPSDLPIIISQRIRDQDFPWKQQAYGVYLTKHWKPHGDDRVFMNATIATGALSFAWRLGARKILLLGIDACVPYPGSKSERPTIYADGTSPWDSWRDGRLVDGVVMQEKHHKWVRAFGLMHESFRNHGCYEKDGLEIYNGSQLSRVSVFPYLSADEFLERFPS